jgi:hypothetical protein
MEEVTHNVAFGYLSVLLGSLATTGTIRERIRLRQPKKTLRPLIASIEEFIQYHKQVDAITQDDEGHDFQQSLTQRLQRMVDELNENIMM